MSLINPKQRLKKVSAEMSFAELRKESAMGFDLIGVGLSYF